LSLLPLVLALALVSLGASSAPAIESLVAIADAADDELDGVSHLRNIDMTAVPARSTDQEVPVVGNHDSGIGGASAHTDLFGRVSTARTTQSGGPRLSPSHTCSTFVAQPPSPGPFASS